MTVPLFVTLDLEIAPDHDRQRQASVLDDLRSDLATLRLPITIFTTADAAEEFKAPLRRLAEAGHEIGCHGTDHGPGDDYRKMSAGEAERRIASAVARIEAATGVRPRSFRGPRMTTSVATERALLRHGFVADLSACPQRLDSFRSGTGLLESALAPRRPYRPSARSAYARGDLPLLAVPLSGALLPFVSGSLYLLGPALTRLFFRLLLAEARATGGTIVYLFHSYEFAAHVARDDRRPVHQRMYVRSPETRYRRSLDLFRFMTSRRSVAATTAADFACARLGGIHHAPNSSQVVDQAPLAHPPNPAVPHPLRQ